MTPQPTDAQVPEANLTIGDLARQTGLTPPVLRMWESRHGFPVAHRLSSGHRRYAADQVDLVKQVVRRRDAGTRLDIAIADVRASRAPGSPSVFATLRSRHPELTPYRLRKSTLIAMSWALEDECCATAQSAVLFGSFQRTAFWEAAIPRWQELARVARSTTVFADFDVLGGDGRGSGPVTIPLAESAPMRREWVVVCDTAGSGSGHPVVLAAWELPGQSTIPDRDRIFEAVWTVDPRAVRDAARVCADVATAAGSTRAAVLQRDLAQDAATVLSDPAATTALFNRIVAYVDRIGG